MKKFFLAFSCIFLFAVDGQVDAYNLEDAANAIVKIHATKTSKNEISRGTGFFTPQGIVTCYHVIYNASEIKVYYGKEKRDTTNVDVIKVIPSKDIAVLRLKERLENISNLQIQSLPLAGLHLHSNNIEILAYPSVGGLFKHYFTGRATAVKNTVPSKSLSGLDRKDIFNEDIKVIPLDVTIYGGVSGAPVLLNGKVIGVLSGSINEGRGIAWAIPISNIDDAGEEYRKGMAWPIFDLMSSNWRSAASPSLARIQQEANMYEGKGNVWHPWPPKNFKSKTYYPTGGIKQLHW